LVCRKYVSRRVQIKLISIESNLIWNNQKFIKN